MRIHSGSAAGPAKVVRRVVLWASRGRAVALGNHVFLPSGSDTDRALLAHELTHCVQYQTWGARRYFARGLREQADYLLHRLFGVGSSPYAYTMEHEKPFESYGMEQQGQIVEDCFRRDATASRISPYRPPPAEGEALGSRL